MSSESVSHKNAELVSVRGQHSFVKLQERKNGVTKIYNHPEQHKQKRGLQFWMTIVTLMISSAIMALDLVGVTTALPIIIGDLRGTQFEWIGSAYALSATAFLPLSGGLAQVFGRKATMLLQLALFAMGSALCGSATSVNFLIVGRTVQGIGAGGIASVTQIVVSDLVPLHERGTFNSLLALAYSLSAGIAPLVSGTLAQKGHWRWFFYLNIPVCGLSAVIVLLFLNLQVPRGLLKEKLAKLDWVGNLIIVASITSVITALTWGGVTYPWSSPRVLVPLIVGMLGIVAFVAYDAKIPSLPLVPFQVMSTRTAISGYVQGFFTNFIMLGTFYYIPVYYQACKGASPIRSGVYSLSASGTCMPFGILAGISIVKSGKYRPQLWFAWVCLMVFSGLFSTLRADSGRAVSIGFQIILGLGLGILATSTFFPVLAPIPVALNANALAFFMFVRFFSQTWGITVGGAILQNELSKRLPADFISRFPRGTSVAYSIIPTISQLEEPFRTEVQIAFAESLQVFWKVLIAIAALGLVSSLLTEGLPLHTEVNEDFGFTEDKVTIQGAGKRNSMFCKSTISTV